MSKRAALKSPTFTLGEVTFVVNKMPAMPAKDLFETLRIGIAEALGGADESGGELAVGLQIVLGLPRPTFDEACQRMFTDITWTSPQSEGASQLYGEEDNAFAGLEALHVYEVFVRALVVNFHGSWVALRSLLPPQARAGLERLVREFLPST